jgi:ceramide glucosyltransferase
VRIVNPTGHWGSVVTHPLPLALIGATLLGFSAFSCWSLVLVAAARFSLKLRLDQAMNASAGPLWLLPVRDALSFAVFIASLFGNEVQWRDRRLRVAKNGAMSYR